MHLSLVYVCFARVVCYLVPGTYNVRVVVYTAVPQGLFSSTERGDIYHIYFMAETCTRYLFNGRVMRRYRLPGMFISLFSRFVFLRSHQSLPSATHPPFHPSTPSSVHPLDISFPHFMLPAEVTRKARTRGTWYQACVTRYWYRLAHR